MTRTTERDAAIRACIASGMDKEPLIRAFNLDAQEIEAIAGLLAGSGAAGPDEGPKPHSGQRRVLEALAHSQSVEVIARETGLSVSSVRCYVTDLRRLGLVAAIDGHCRQQKAALAETIAQPIPPASEEEAALPRAELLFRQRIGAARFRDDARQAAISRLAEPLVRCASGSDQRTLGGVVGSMT